MHLSPAANQHSLKNKHRMFYTFQYFSDLSHVLQHQFKSIRLAASSISFPVIYRTKNHILFVLHKKTENVPDISKGIFIQQLTAICVDIKQYQCQRLPLSQTPSQFSRIYTLFNHKSIDPVPSSAGIFRFIQTLCEFCLPEIPAISIYHIFPEHVSYLHPS